MCESYWQARTIYYSRTSKHLVNIYFLAIKSGIIITVKAGNSPEMFRGTVQQGYLTTHSWCQILYKRNSVFNNLIMGIVHLPLCCDVLNRSQPLDSAHIQRKWIAKGMSTTKLGSMEAHLMCLLKTEFCEMGLEVKDSVQFTSVAQSFPTLCSPMNRSTPGLPVHHQLLEFTQTHVHQVGDAIQPSHPLSSPSPPAPNTSPYQGLLQWISSSHEVAKVLEFQLQHQSFQWTPKIISFRMYWLDILAVQGTLNSLLQHQSSKASIFQHSAENF